MVEDPEAVLARRLEVARQSGVPEEPLRRYAAERGRTDPGIAGPIEPDRDLLAGVTVADRPRRVGDATRRPATRPRTCACSSPSGAC